MSRLTAYRLLFDSPQLLPFRFVGGPNSIHAEGRLNNYQILLVGYLRE